MDDQMLRKLNALDTINRSIITFTYAITGYMGRVVTTSSVDFMLSCLNDVTDNIRIYTEMLLPDNPHRIGYEGLRERFIFLGERIRESNFDYIRR